MGLQFQPQIYMAMRPVMCSYIAHHKTGLRLWKSWPSIEKQLASTKILQYKKCCGIPVTEHWCCQCECHCCTYCLILFHYRFLHVLCFSTCLCRICRYIEQWHRHIHCQHHSQLLHCLYTTYDHITQWGILSQGYFYCQCLRWSWRKIRTCLHHWTMCIRKQPHSPWRQCWSQNLRRIKTEGSTREWWRILWSMERKTRNIRHTLRIFPFEYRISFWDFFSKLHTINSFLLWALKIIIIKSQSFTYVYNSRYVRIKVRKRLL